MRYFNIINKSYKSKIQKRMLTYRNNNSNKNDKTTFDFGSFLFFFVCLAGLSKNSRN
jgi:hypothetical protein